MNQKILNHVGRSMLGLYFLLPGLMKFISWETHVGLMEKHGMVFVPVMLAVAGVAQILGGIALIANRYVAVCALGFALMIVLINANLHDFWNYAGIERAHEYQNFFKNLGIFAGLLVLAAANLKPKS